MWWRELWPLSVMINSCVCTGYLLLEVAKTVRRQIPTLLWAYSTAAAIACRLERGSLRPGDLTPAPLECDTREAPVTCSLKDSFLLPFT